jgi:mono/diheme cytochrome c family protein
MQWRVWRTWLTATGLMLALSGCDVGGEVDVVERGRRTYVANCAACHHPNPTLEGSLGPPIAGSPQELVEARVLRGGYPNGYTPQRDTALMQPLPYLNGELDALVAYLASVAGPAAP